MPRFLLAEIGSHKLFLSSLGKEMSQSLSRLTIITGRRLCMHMGNLFNDNSNLHSQDLLCKYSTVLF
jgi:hypothetical protein